MPRPPPRLQAARADNFMEAIQHSTQAGLLRPLRKLGLAAASRWPWPVRVKIRNGRRMFVDLRSRVGRNLFMRGEFDPEVFTPLRGVLKPGGTFLDVGANAGFYSMLALDCIGPTGTIHAFDVDPRALRCLRRTVQTEAIPNLIVHEVAVTDSEGEVHLDQIADCGRTRIQRDGRGSTVPATTLDQWYEQGGARNIQAIKMDIEGGELAALRGAANLLRAEKPLLVCELLESHASHAGYQPSDVIGFLESLGCQVRWQEGVRFPGIIAEWPSVSPISEVPCAPV